MLRATHEILKTFPAICQLQSLSTLPKKMEEEKVIQLCGNDNPAIRTAITTLKKGGIIALPTDTVFGLACDSSNSAAIADLYQLKGRDFKKPLAIAVGSIYDVKDYGVTGNLPKGLLKKLLPGPVTVLLNRKPKLNPDLNPGEKKVGIRVPLTTWHPFIDYVAGGLGHPLALTSANLSGEPNCIKVEEFKHLWPKLAYVFDTSDNKVEEVTCREGSTIVDLSEPGKFSITRSGVAYDQTLNTLRKFKLEEVKPT